MIPLSTISHVSPTTIGQMLSGLSVASGALGFVGLFLWQVRSALEVDSE